jgi:tyrosine-protein phosphatase YwqE
MIDLHTHILPGVDDGPADLAEAVAMARAAQAAGVQVVVATPHALGTRLDVTPQARDQGITALRAELARHQIPLSIVPGFECQVVADLADILLAQPEYLYPIPVEGSPVENRQSLGGPGPVENRQSLGGPGYGEPGCPGRKALWMPGPGGGEPGGPPQGLSGIRWLAAAASAASLPPSRHVLIELSEDLPVTCLDSLLFRLQRVRITPVLAHPERHPDIARSVATIEGFVRNGGKLQITAGGLLGDGGGRERRVCETLLRQRLVTVLATDAHGVAEAGLLRQALARATKLIGSAAQDLVHAAPAAILSAPWPGL